MVKLGEVGPAIWEKIIAEMETKLQDIEFKGEDILPDWRKLAHKHKLDREIFEKYGHFKDIILHPKFQMVKHYMEEHADFNMMVGEPLLPWHTAIILLFMLNRRVNSTALSLVAVFLFNFNPFYVGIAVLCLLLTTKTSHKPKQYKHRKVVTKSSESSIVYKPQDVKVAQDSLASQYDHVLIGSDVSTLYTAALLAKAGHRCCVLQPKQCNPLEISPVDAPCATPIVQCAVGRVDRYQMLLDAAQSTTDNKDRVLFQPIGNKSDGFTSAIVGVREVPQSSKNSFKLSSSNNSNSIRTLCIRSGEQSLAYDLCSSLTVEKSLLLQCFHKIADSFQHITSYFVSKIVAKPDWVSSGLGNKDVTKSITELLRASVEQVLVQNGLESNRVLESLAALGCTVGIEEALLASEGSAVAVANAIAVSESGRYVPVGGVTKIIESLTRSIMESDGMVLKNVEIKRMDIEEMLTTTAVAQHGKMPYKAVGVTIAGPNSTASTTTDDDSAEISIQASKSIVSGLGYLSTYTTLLPAECVSPDTRQQLDNLKESRPKLKVALWLQGQAEELGLTSTDYFEIGNPVPVAVRSSEENEGKLAAEHLALSYIHVWSPSMQDQDWTQSHPKDSHVLIVEFEVTEPLVYLETDRTFSNQSELFHHGPKFYCTTRESESNPNHAKFASKIGRPLNISISKQQEYLQKAESIVATLFPKTVQKVSFKQLVLPYLGGHRVANNTAKFECNLSATTEVQNFFLTGCDLSSSGLMGDLQSGWVAANAVLGYNLTDLQSNRNIITDLQSVRR